jgi:hypothetical protein
LESQSFALKKNTERAMFNAKVLKFKMLLALLEVDIDALPEKLGMKEYRLSWLLNDKVSEDRLSTIKKSELLLLGIILRKDVTELSKEYGLGDPTWYEDSQDSVHVLSKKCA